MDKKYMLSEEDIELLAESSTATVNRWEILIGSADTSFCSTVKELFSDDDRVVIDVASNGCDFLVTCAVNIPHLVIIDEALRDIKSIELIKCLKRRDEFMDIKILYAVKSEDRSASYENDVDDYFIKGDIDDIYLSRKISTHLFASDHVPPPKRRWSRHDIDLPAELLIRTVSKKDRIIRGKAKLANISRMGAFLTDIFIEGDFDPAEEHQVVVKIDHEPLKEWEAGAVFVNFRDNRTSGLRFLKLSKKNHIKLLLMVDL